MTIKIGVLIRSSHIFINLLKNRICTSKFSVIPIDFQEEKLSGCNKEKERVAQQVNNVEILIADPHFIAPIIYNIDKVKWCHSTWAGVDTLTKTLLNGQPPNFTLTRYAGTLGPHMAEYVIGNIISLERKSLDYHYHQEKKIWSAATPETNYRLLSELSISILGCGDLGRSVGKSCKDFGMTVYGMVSNIPDKKQKYIDEYFTSAQLTDYLKKSDYVCNVLPITSKTDDILSGKLNHCVERRSVFINIGRGNVVDEEEIVEALKKGWLRGAILDVFRTEPLPSTHELWTLPNVVITPHVSAITFDRHLIDSFLNQLKLYEMDEKLQYVVDWEKGY